MELTLDELKQLETLLKKAHPVVATDYPYYGKTWQLWQGDKVIDVGEDSRRRIDRGKK